MQIKKLVNDKALWDSFTYEIEERITFCHKQLEQSSLQVEIHRYQGQIQALRSLLLLRELVNTRDAF